MEELIQRIDQLTEAIRHNSVPLWIAYIGTFIPIIISILLLWQTFRLDKKNKQLQVEIAQNNERLQRDLSSRDERIQMREEFLKIYDSFCLAQSILGNASGHVHIYYSNFSVYNGITTPLQFINQLKDATSTVFQATNKATLLLPSSDAKFKQFLLNIANKIKEICNKAGSYYSSGYAYSVSENAWDTIGPSHGIQRYDYQALTSNFLAYDNFLKLCINESTDEIEIMIKETLPLFEYGLFDQHFEPYLQMGYSEDTVNNSSDK